MNKALDFNGLLEAHRNGKQLKKDITFPLYVETKYDGNFVSVKVECGKAVFITSGNLTYTHTDEAGDFFKGLPDGVYECERIYGEGKLGDRVKCNLRGPKTAQTSTKHNYKVFDHLTINEWTLGKSERTFQERRAFLIDSKVPNITVVKLITNRPDLELHLKDIVSQGYEGLMMKSPSWCWERTTSRKPTLCKYKKRRTADLKCINILSGEGKYLGLVGSLKLEDSQGRTVLVGSGLSDWERDQPNTYFIGKIIEIEYEQILDTYIQPTYLRVRDDKVESD